MVELDAQTRERIESQVLRRLLRHLQHRTDAQNVDLMGLAGFCRNCLADWFREAAHDEGVEMDKPAARREIYGMDYDEWKFRYQAPASEEQLLRMQESVGKNADSAS